MNQEERVSRFEQQPERDALVNEHSRELSENAAQKEQEDPQAQDLQDVSLPVVPTQDVSPEGSVVEQSTEVSAVETTPTQEVDSGKWSPKKFYEPKPSRGLISLLSYANDWFMLRGLPVLRHIPLVNRIPLLGQGLYKFKSLDIPKEDVSRLKTAVNKDTAAYLAPNHPEFSPDWMIDKEISRRVSPLMAHWADQAVVNMHPLVQKFWLACNLVANVRQGGGKEYSKKWALKGHGVLLHPEGMVGWSGNKVFQIYPGIVDMAVETALQAKSDPADSARPVYIAPFVMKYAFDRDVSKQLHGEMKRIEKRLSLPTGNGLSLEERFFALQKHLLEKQEARFELPEAIRQQEITGANYFDRQQVLFDHLKDDVVARYGNVSGEQHRWLFRLDAAIRKSKDTDPAIRKEDQAKIREMRRLMEFSEELYGAETLTQDEIAESLKRNKRDLICSSFLEVASNYIPIAVAKRVAHVRVPEPINVSELLDQAGGDSPELREELLQRTHQQMQDKLTELAAELRPSQEPFVRRNPLHRTSYVQ